MKKQVLIFLMALVMIVSLVGCGGSKNPAGTYKLTALNSGGINMNVKELADLFEMDIEATLELKDDSSFTLDMGFLGEGEITSGTWKINGDSLILTAEGQDLSAAYNGKTVVIDMEGESLTFEKQ